MSSRKCSKRRKTHRIIRRKIKRRSSRRFQKKRILRRFQKRRKNIESVKDININITVDLNELKSALSPGTFESSPKQFHKAGITDISTVQIVPKLNDDPEMSIKANNIQPSCESPSKPLKDTKKRKHTLSKPKKSKLRKRFYPSRSNNRKYKYKKQIQSKLDLENQKNCVSKDNIKLSNTREKVNSSEKYTEKCSPENPLTHLENTVQVDDKTPQTKSSEVTEKPTNYKKHDNGILIKPENRDGYMNKPTFENSPINDNKRLFNNNVLTVKSTCINSVTNKTTCNNTDKQTGVKLGSNTSVAGVSANRGSTYKPMSSNASGTPSPNKTVADKATCRNSSATTITSCNKTLTDKPTYTNSTVSYITNCQKTVADKPTSSNVAAATKLCTNNTAVDKPTSSSNTSIVNKPSCNKTVADKPTSCNMATATNSNKKVSEKPSSSNTTETTICLSNKTEAIIPTSNPEVPIKSTTPIETTNKLHKDRGNCSTPNSPPVVKSAIVNANELVMMQSNPANDPNTSSTPPTCTNSKSQQVNKNSVEVADKCKGAVTLKTPTIVDNKNKQCSSTCPTTPKVEFSGTNIKKATKCPPSSKPSEIDTTDSVWDVCAHPNGTPPCKGNTFKSDSIIFDDSPNCEYSVSATDKDTVNIEIKCTTNAKISQSKSENKPKCEDTKQYQSKINTVKSISKPCANKPDQDTKPHVETNSCTEEVKLCTCVKPNSKEKENQTIFQENCPVCSKNKPNPNGKNINQDKGLDNQNLFGTPKTKCDKNDQ